MLNPFDPVDMFLYRMTQEQQEAQARALELTRLEFEKAEKEFPTYMNTMH